MLPNTFIEQVIKKTEILNLIPDSCQLKPFNSKTLGPGFKGYCPLPDCPARRPLFLVSQIRQVYFCHGCRRCGNVISYLKDLLGISERLVIVHLATKAGIRIPAATEDQDDQSSLFPNHRMDDEDSEE